MADPSTLEDGQSQRRPTPLSYDPSRGEAPVARGAGTVVLLLVGESDRRWAAEAALGLCSTWARGGRRVVLADLDLDAPIVHEVAGVDDSQGIVDIFLYGASVGSSARAVPGEGFYLIPVGTYEPDATAIYHHPRWPKLVAGFRDANATLVLFAPVSTADVPAIAEWVDELIVLGAAGDVPGLDILAAKGVEAEAILVQPGAVPPASAGEAGVTVPALTDEEKELIIPPEPRRHAEPIGRHLPTIVAVVAAAAVFAIAGFLLARNRPDLVPWAGEAATPAAVAPAVQRQARSGPSPTGAPLPYSVTGWAFMTLEAAEAHAEVERTRFDTAPFFVSPEEIQGVLYYKVLAGAVVDTAAASRLRTDLVESGAIEPTESIIQFSPLAFDLGEFESEGDAVARADSLAEEEVPAYVLSIPYSDGTRRWQLYGGAYRDSVSAEAMRQHLSAAGLSARLVARIGESRGGSR